jgi:hypothetical protein
MGASRSRSFSLLFAAVVLFGLALGGKAFAQQDAEKQIQRMNKRAMADYDSLEFELSRKSLMDAVALLRSSGLDDSPVAAKTYMNLGVVYVAGFKDRNRGLQQFVQALKINPSLKLDPNIASPELEEVFDAARKQVGVSAPPTNPNTGTKPPPTGDNDLPPTSANDVKGLQHNPADEARAGEPLTVKALVGSDVGARSVALLYRPSGQADFVTVQMKSNGGADWIGVIPGDVIVDHPIQYFIEARDKRGKQLVSSGSAANPYIVTIAEVAPGTHIAHAPPPKKKKEEDKDHIQRLFAFVMPGFGFGYQPTGNKSEVAWQANTSGTGNAYQQAQVGKCPCGVVAPFHIGVELGAMITRHFSLSLLGRFQVVTGANAQSIGTIDPKSGTFSPGGIAPGTGTTKAGGAVAGFLRARYRFLDGKFHPYLTVSIGGGEIRDQLNLAVAESKGGYLVDASTAYPYNQKPPSTPSAIQVVCKPGAKCYDSLKMGDFFIGGGGGIWYDVQKYVALILDVNVLGGIAAGTGGQSGLNIDVQLGVGVHFL